MYWFLDFRKYNPQDCWFSCSPQLDQNRPSCHAPLDESRTSLISQPGLDPSHMSLNPESKVSDISTPWGIGPWTTGFVRFYKGRVYSLDCTCQNTHSTWCVQSWRQWWGLESRREGKPGWLPTRVFFETFSFNIQLVPSVPCDRFNRHYHCNRLCTEGHDLSSNHNQIWGTHFSIRIYPA